MQPSTGFHQSRSEGAPSTLYGRGDDCDALSELLEQAQHGTSGAVTVRGEAGVGKTALVDWLSHEAAQREMTLLRCAGVEAESDLPFAGLHQLLRPAIPAMPAIPRLQQESLNGALGLSGRRAADPFLVAVAALSLLGEIAGDRGVACVVDDAQWLDSASADVLRFVARRLDVEGVVLLFSVREAEDARFPTPGVPEHRLRGIDAMAAFALLQERAPMVTEEVAAQLVEHHAGNPLAIIELAPLLTDGQLTGEEPLPVPMPMGGEVEHLYAARAAALTPQAQGLLLLAATADTGDLGIILRAADQLGIAADWLAEVEASNLISTSRGQLRFKHPLVRSAIYQRATFLERQRGHLAMAALLTSDAEADRRAWHLMHAATGLDDELAELLASSADRAMARAGPASAIDRWQWSADFTTSSETRAARLLQAAEAALLAGRPQRTRQLLNDADPSSSSTELQGAMTALKGAVELRHGAPEAAYPLLLDAARTLADLQPTSALNSLVMAGEAAAFLGEPRRTSQVGALAERLRDGDASAGATMIDLLVGLGKLFEGNWADGSRILAGVVDETVAGGDYQRIFQSGRAAMYLGRLTDARDLYSRAVVHTRGAAAVGQLTPMLDRLAYIELLIGRLADAEAHAGEGLRLAGDFGIDAGVALSTLATVHAYRGEEDKCREHAQVAAEVASSRQLRMIGAASQWALGLLALGAGRPAEALAALSSVASETEGHPGIVRWATPDLVEAAVRAGAAEACAPALARLEAWAQVSGLGIPIAMLSRCRGLLTSGEEAISHYEEALRADERDTRPLERARIELLLGETLRRARQRTRAREHLRVALRVFERVNALPWAHRARSELRATGESTAPVGPSDFQHLTPQELQIARYAASGETNADIAAKLFLSRRTVEYHLAKVYTKTGVTSRRELASTALDGD